MKRKVFCIGTLKTGTTSLGAALETLGYKHTGFNADLLRQLRLGNHQPLLDFAEDFEAFDDWPWAVGEFYKVLDRAFPGSQFIYTDRGLIPWAKSYFRYFYSDPEWPHGTPDDFDDAFPDLILERRERKRNILKYFADRPRDLLVIDVTAGEGWEKLCPFLGVRIPGEPFPHANSSSSSHR